VEGREWNGFPPLSTLYTCGKMRVISYPHTKQIRPRRPGALRGAVALGAVVLAFLCACVFAAPVVARLIPPRYVARFVPEPLQGYFQLPRVELPTPVAAPHAVASLLTPIPTVPSSPAPQVRQPTSTVQPTGTLVRRVTPTPVVFPNATIAARMTPASIESATVLLTGFRHAFQGWNNCGPANLAMALSYHGWKGTQAQAAASLKPDPEDRNVNPDEMATFVRSQGFQAIVRANGSLDLLKALIRAGFPPIVEKGFEPEEKLGWMGHYEVLAGWNDTTREFIAMDSYLGPNQSVPFDEIDKYWRQFNRTYIVVCKPEQAEALSRIIGADMNDATMYRNALLRAQAEVASNPKDAFGWFNVGTNYAALGMPTESVAAYDQARRIGLPWRMTWYQFGWFEVYLATNRLDDVLALAEATLKSNPYAEEMYLYKGFVFQKRGDANAAREQFNLALQHNPNLARARQALETLKP
jgi:tetratricopeptide (TPR) repeat protein